MSLTQSALVALSGTLTTLAVASFVALTPALVCGNGLGCNCIYADIEYFHGACINTDYCLSPKGITCDGGVWTGCNDECSEVSPCEGQR